MDLGKDDKTGERLYEFHNRRAAKITSLRAALQIFRGSSYGAEFRKLTTTKKRPQGLNCSYGTFTKYQCPCVKKRKASQCDCPKCTYLIENTRILHEERARWHRNLKQRIGGAACVCHIHQPAGAVGSAAAQVEMLEERLQDMYYSEEFEGIPEEVIEAAITDLAAAETKLKDARNMAERARKYDNMTVSLPKLTSTLMPCGKQAYPDYSIIGEATFRDYKRTCIGDNCELKIFRGGQACGFDRVFRQPCPMENNDEAMTWWRWEKRQRGVKKDSGEAFYSLEWVPHHGTRKEFWAEFLPALRDGMLHQWRERTMRQSIRVLNDRRSGHHYDALTAQATERWQEEARLRPDAALMAEALHIAAKHMSPVQASLIGSGRGPNNLCEGEEVAVASVAVQELGTRPAWHGLARLAERELKMTVPEAEVRAWASSHSQAKAAEASAATARAVLGALSGLGVKQADYAAQLETCRRYTATCAIMERHNYLVTLVTYKPYKKEVYRRPRKPAPRRALAHGTSERPALAAPGTEAVAAERARTGLTTVYQQRCDVYFAFHKAGFKPSARSYNVVQEDIDHWLKHGSFLHGEWFTHGQRCPGGDHSLPLPGGLCEWGAGSRPLPEPLAACPQKPLFPTYKRQMNITDGCPNQFAYGTNYHQTGVWAAKSACWAVSAADAKVAAAEAASAVKQEHLSQLLAAAAAAADADAVELARAECTSARAQLCAAKASAEAVRSEGGWSDAIQRTSVKLVEYHGKAAYDALGNVPKHATKAAIANGAILDPSTRDLVLYLAEHKPVSCCKCCILVIVVCTAPPRRPHCPTSLLAHSPSY